MAAGDISGPGVRLGAVSGAHMPGVGVGVWLGSVGRAYQVAINSPTGATTLTVDIATPFSGDRSFDDAVVITWGTSGGTAGTVTYPTATTWACNVRASLDDIAETVIVATCGTAQDTLTVTVSMYEPDDVLTGTPTIAAWDMRYGVTGSPPSQIDDLTANARHLTQPGAAKPTLATDWSDSGQCLAFNSASVQHMLADVAPELSGLQTHTLVSMLRYDSTAGTHNIFGGGSASHNLQDMVAGSYLAGNRFIGSTATKWGPQSGDPNYGNTDDGVELLFIRTYDSGTGMCRLIRAGIAGNEYDMDVGSLVLDAVALGATLTGGTSPANGFHGRVRAACILDRVATDSDCAALAALYARGRYAKITVEGDSIAINIYAGGAGQLVTKLNPSTESPRFSFVDVSGSGHTLYAQMIPQYPTEVAPEYESAIYRDSIVFCNGGGNDIHYGRTGAQALADALTWIGLAQATGFKVIYADTMPRTTFDATKEGYRLQLNAGLAAAASGLGANFQLVQWSTVPEAQNPSNTTYFSDGVHPTTALNAILAARVKTAADILTGAQ